MTAATERLRFVPGPISAQPRLDDIVRAGLSASPKSLPCHLFYDRRGSELFEAICRLPEYYPTRTEISILNESAPEILEMSGRDLSLVELGGGSGRKTRIFIDHLLAKQPRLLYVPIDVSGEFLKRSAAALCRKYPTLWVTAIAAEYRSGLDEMPEKAGPRLILFLGSNIGNFEAPEAARFLLDIRHRMRADDRLLLGMDLVKDRRVLEAAYNDPAGITAEFNKNILHRINRELGAAFVPSQFDHSAPWVEPRSRIEMHLVSRIPQKVSIPALSQEFSFAESETIHTENSHKYTADSFARLAEQAGLRIIGRWTDPRDWFAVTLMSPAP